MLMTSFRPITTDMLYLDPLHAPIVSGTSTFSNACQGLPKCLLGSISTNARCNTENAEHGNLRIKHKSPRSAKTPQRSSRSSQTRSIHWGIAYKITQQPPLSPFSNVSRAFRVAASNTSSTPSPVSDEHSRYFRAPISCAVSLPSFGVMNRSDFFRISSCASGSSRRSFFRPTRMMGTPGHLSLASSTHCTQMSVLGGS